MDVTRESFHTLPPGPRDLTLDQYELRQKADVCLRPTAPYVGLALDAAEVLANLEGAGQPGGQSAVRAPRTDGAPGGLDRVSRPC